MMLTQMQIIDAMERRAMEFAEESGLPIAMPNIKFDPPADGVWLECFVIPGETESMSLDGAMTSDVGIMQISVHYPSDAGMSAARNVADALIAFFPHNMAITVSGEKIWLDEPTTAARAINNQIPVTVNYSYVGALSA